MRRLLLALLLAATGSAAAQRPAVWPDTLTATLVLPRGVTLPPEARANAVVLDANVVSLLGDGTLGVGGRSGQVRFSVGYDAGRVDPNRDYVISAEIRNATSLRLYESSPDYIPVHFDRRGRPSAPVRITFAQPARTDPAVEPPAPAKLKAPGGASGAGPSPVEGPPILPPVAVPSIAAGDLMNTTWAFTDIGPRGEVVRPVDRSEGYSLVFRGSRVYSGEAGCARFFGRYRTSETGGLTLSPPTVTRAGCPAGPAPADPVFDVLAGVERYGGGRTELTLSGTAGLLVFLADVRPRSGLVIPQVDRLSEYACGDAGTFLLRTGRGDAEVWLSDALAARAGAGAPLGTYHILGQVPAPGDVARYAYGPLAAVVDGEGVQGETAGLEIGAERLRCMARPDPDVSIYGGRVNDLPDIQSEGPDGMVQIYGTASRAVYLSFWDGLSLFGSPATVTTPAPGVTEVRGEYGVVATVTLGACTDGRDRVRLARPEGTSDGCRMVIE